VCPQSSLRYLSVSRMVNPSCRNSSVISVKSKEFFGLGCLSGVGTSPLAIASFFLHLATASRSTISLCARALLSLAEFLLHSAVLLSGLNALLL